MYNNTQPALTLQWGEMNASCFIQPVFGSKQDHGLQDINQERQVKEVNMLFWSLMRCENEVLSLGSVTFND